MTNHIVCNWCETETTEQQLQIKLDAEHCPQCGNNGYLMDMQETQFDGYGQCEGCEKWDCVNKYNECETCCDNMQETTND